MRRELKSLRDNRLEVVVLGEVLFGVEPGVQHVGGLRLFLEVAQLVLVCDVINFLHRNRGGPEGELEEVLEAAPFRRVLLDLRVPL